MVPVAEKSAIEWLGDPFLRSQGATWNCWWGCDMVGPECFSCYITRTPPLRIRGMKWDGAGIGASTGIVFAERRVLFMPLRKTKPLLIFPESLGDLWHEDVELHRVAEMYAIMLLAWWHIFQTCTKRATRQHRCLTSPMFAELVADAVERIAVEHNVKPADLERARAHLAERLPGGAMRPLPNVWVGVTVGCNQSAKTRIPYLHRTPKALGWLSCEPITDEDFNLGQYLRIKCRDCDRYGLKDVPEGGTIICPTCDGAGSVLVDVGYVIFGGESGYQYQVHAPDTGPGTRLRRLDLDLLRFLIRQVRFLLPHAAVSVKQLGTPWAVLNGATHPKGGDWSEWPEDLRIREYPRQLAERALRVDPGNELALAYLAELAARKEAVDVPF